MCVCEINNKLLRAPRWHQMNLKQQRSPEFFSSTATVLTINRIEYSRMFWITRSTEFGSLGARGCYWPLVDLILGAPV